MKKDAEDKKVKEERKIKKEQELSEEDLKKVAGGKPDGTDGVKKK